MIDINKKIGKFLTEEDTTEEINFNGLESKLSNLGIYVKLTGNLEESRGKRYIKFTSDNIVSKAGVMKVALTNLRIVNFGGSESKETPGVFWVPVHFEFELKNGGSNGMKILTAWYDSNTKKWTFEE